MASKEPVTADSNIPAFRLADMRSLALHFAVADKLRKQPELFAVVPKTLERWRQTVAASSQGYLSEWALLVHQGMEAALTVATEDSEHAQTLRQCSPFGGILSHQERFAFLKSWSEQHASR